MAPVTVADLVQRNEKHVATFSPLPTFPEVETLKLDPPKLLIVSCADPRVIPERFFGLNYLEAVVVRVTAGHPQHAIKEVLGLDALLKFTDIIVVHHTDCGSTYLTEEMVRNDIKSRCPHEQNIDSMTFGAVSTRFAASHPQLMR